MKKLHYLWCVLVFFCMYLPSKSNAQDEFDTSGKEFWVMFNENISSPSPRLFITGEVATTGTVSSASGIFADISFTVTPGAVTTVTLPASTTTTGSDNIRDLGVFVSAQEDITLYGINQRTFSTDAFLAFPVDILGTEYITLGYKNPFNSTQFGIVATEDNTTITITPSTTAGFGRTANVPYTITLNEGQSYQLQASASNADLSGSIISSDKPIGVFGGHTCTQVPSGTAACDHIVEMLPPTTTWGAEFVTVPLATRNAGDRFRILAAEDGTNVQVNGNAGYSRSFTLNRGEFEEIDIPSNVFTRINADKPILVAQYSKGSNADGVTSDPFMVLIPPSEQFLASYTVTTPATGFPINFINVVTETSNKSNITLDGSLVSDTEFTDIPGTSLSGAQLSVSTGNHSLSSPNPFGIFVYGFGSFDSYGYVGGQGVAEVATVDNIVLTVLTDPAITGEPVTVSALVTNDEGDPVPGVRVDFDVTGANTVSGFSNTNASGIANFVYTPANSGTDNYSGSIGTNSNTTSATIVDRIPSLLVLDPSILNVTAGDEVTVTGTVFDQFGDPLAGVEVFTRVEGANPMAQMSAITDSNGEVVLTYTATNSGTDVVICFFSGGPEVTSSVSIAPISGTSTTWNGSSWSNGVPDADTDAIINGPYTVPAGDPITAKSITVNPGGSITIPDGATLICLGACITNNSIVCESGGSLCLSESVDGEVTYIRNTRFTNGRYSYIGSPVTPTQVSDLSRFAYGYDETVDYSNQQGLSRWFFISGTLAPGTGFASAFTGTVSVTGEPNVGDVTVNGLTHTVQGFEGNRGWNIVANPYGCAIDPVKFFDANPNVDECILLWDDFDESRGSNGDYRVIDRNNVTGIGPNSGNYGGAIGSFQAFFIRLSDPTSNGSVVFTPDMQVAGNNADENFFRTLPDTQFVTFALNGKENGYSEAALQFDDDATELLDPQIEVFRFEPHADLTTRLFSIAEKEDLLIQHLPLPGNGTQEVLMGMSFKNEGSYTLSVKDFRLNGKSLVLLDRATGKVTDLNVNSYHFTARAGENKDRFKLFIGKHAYADATDRLNALSEFSYRLGQNELQMYFGSDMENVDLKVFNLQGRVIQAVSQIPVNNQVAETTLNLTTKEVYILKVSTPFNTYTEKVLMND